MSPAIQRKSTTKRRKKQAAPGWLGALWPLILGIVVTPLAVYAASILAMRGPTALRLLYPFMLLVQGHSEQFATSQQETLAQWVMYGQFPLYGCVWMLARRLFRGSAGALSALVLHCAGVAAAILAGNG